MRRNVLFGILSFLLLFQFLSNALAATMHTINEFDGFRFVVKREQAFTQTGAIVPSPTIHMILKPWNSRENQYQGAGGQCAHMVRHGYLPAAYQGMTVQECVTATVFENRSKEPYKAPWQSIDDVPPFAEKKMLANTVSYRTLADHGLFMQAYARWLEGKHSETVTQLSSATDRMTALRQQIGVLQDSNTALKAANNEIGNSQQTKTHLLKALHSKVEELTAERDRLIAERNKLSTTVAHLEKTLAEQGTQIAPVEWPVFGANMFGFNLGLRPLLIGFAFLGILTIAFLLGRCMRNERLNSTISTPNPNTRTSRHRRPVVTQIQPIAPTAPKPQALSRKKFFIPGWLRFSRLGIPQGARA